MKVFKFGGASVQNASGYRNVAKVLQLFAGESIVIVLSAMGKTTNAIELIARKAYAGEEYSSEWTDLRRVHESAIQELGLDLSLTPIFEQLASNLQQYRQLPFDQYYDQTVPFGELLSSNILSHYLQNTGLANTWIPAGELLLTDDTWREGTVDMVASAEAIVHAVLPALQNGHVVTQGFLGKFDRKFYTTLGREGSDYTAAILANCLDAEGVWIWKDVPGVLTGDPKEFRDVSLLEELSYYEAIEMTYYGATVIHPKTLQPLREKQIPLYVRSFLHPENNGTTVFMDTGSRKYPPLFVLKNNQILITIGTRDYSFMAEHHLSQLYKIFHDCHVRINLLQTSALSLSVVVDSTRERMDHLLTQLNRYFTVKTNEGLQLLTIRHYTPQVLEDILGGKEPFLTQKSRQTIQMVIKH